MSKWPVSDSVRAVVIRNLAHLAQYGEDEAVQVAASKALMAADDLNLKKEREEQRKLEAEHARKLQLIELAAKLGITGDVGPRPRTLDCESSKVEG